MHRVQFGCFFKCFKDLSILVGVASTHRVMVRLGFGELCTFHCRRQARESEAAHPKGGGARGGGLGPGVVTKKVENHCVGE